jgi:hypothetical protein
MAIALKIEVPWDRGNEVHNLQLRLVDADGEPVLAEGPEGEQPIAVDAEFETGRPAGLRPGTPLDFAMAVNFPPLPLAPATRYEWRLAIDGEEAEGWRLAFSTRSLPRDGE